MAKLKRVSEVLLWAMAGVLCVILSPFLAGYIWFIERREEEIEYE